MSTIEIKLRQHFRWLSDTLFFQHTVRMGNVNEKKTYPCEIFFFSRLTRSISCHNAEVEQYQLRRKCVQFCCRYRVIQSKLYDESWAVTVSDIVFASANAGSSVVTSHSLPTKNNYVHYHEFISCATNSLGPIVSVFFFEYIAFQISAWGVVIWYKIDLNFSMRATFDSNFILFSRAI